MTASPNQEEEELVLARYRAAYVRRDGTLFAFIDRIVSAFVGLFPRNVATVPLLPTRILVANAGHLGDVIMSTSVVQALARTYPGAEIGFMTGHYSRPAAEGMAGVCRVHYLSHWHAARGKGSRLGRILRYYLRDQPRMRSEISALHYDMVVDLRAWFPTYAPLFWFARVPVRVGFGRLGFSSMLTHCAPVPYDRRHEVSLMHDLLRLIGVPNSVLDHSPPELPTPSSADMAMVRDRLPAGPYYVLHPASSTPLRDWPVEKWVELARHTLRSGVVPVITGIGSRDQGLAEAIAAAVPEVFNVVGQFSWAELAAVLYGADAVYSVETSVGHYARALGKPVVSIHGGMSDPRHWAPHGASLALNPLPCSPCFSKQGCEHRRCITGVSVDTVKAALESAKAR